MAATSDRIKANVFIDILRKYTDRLTRQEILTLRERARNGDVSGAWRELNLILRGKVGR